MSLRVRVLFSILTIVIIAVPFFAFAQFPERIVPCTGVDCTVCDIAKLANNALQAGIAIAIFLSAILFAWAGWKYVTAGGNASQATAAREIFTNVLIGLVIIIAGWLVVDTIMRTLTGDKFGPWNKICGPQTDAAGRVLGGV